MNKQSKKAYQSPSACYTEVRLADTQAKASSNTDKGYQNGGRKGSYESDSTPGIVQ